MIRYGPKVEINIKTLKPLIMEHPENSEEYKGLVSIKVLNNPHL
jgi:hypothetical protein